jgi:hypothetical protein
LVNTADRMPETATSIASRTGGNAGKKNRDQDRRDLHDVFSSVEGARPKKSTFPAPTSASDCQRC